VGTTLDLGGELLWNWGGGSLQVSEHCPTCGRAGRASRTGANLCIEEHVGILLEDVVKTRGGDRFIIHTVPCTVRISHIAVVMARMTRVSSMHKNCIQSIA
jgi:hypothetical protein